MAKGGSATTAVARRANEVAHELALDLEESVAVRSIARHYAETEERLERLERVCRDLCNEYRSYEEFDPIREVLGLPSYFEMLGTDG